MDPEAPMCGNRRGSRRWIRIPLILLTSPLIVAVLGNLWLSSPRGCEWVAAKLQRRTGLDASLGGVSIWPWNGVSLHGVVLLQPSALRPSVKEPLARIATIRLTPVWRSWLRGKRDFRAAELDTPQLVVPLELLANLATSQTPAVATAPPVVAATPPPTAPPVVTPASPSAAPLAPPETVPKVPAIVQSPTGWLHVKNASFILLSASSGKRWFELSGCSGSIPLAGGPARSNLRVRSIQAAGGAALTNLSAALDWQAPLLSLKPLETGIHGLNVILAGKLGMLAGLPLQIEAQLPRQPLASVALPGDGHAAAEAIFVNARFRGFLLGPSTWQGDLVAESQSPSARIAGQDAKFDRGSAVTVLRGGVLSCVDARLISDELSFLGNATLLADGRAAAALRMVAPTESTNVIVARVFPSIPQPPSLTPLSTPQRSAFDVEASGTIQQMFLRLGTAGPVIELKR